MRLLIKFPTRNRPTKFLKTLDTYLRFLDDKTTPFIITCDNDDDSMKDDYINDYLAMHDNIKVCFGDNVNKIAAVNADLQGVDFDIVLLASDDMIPVVKGFDTIIKNKMVQFYPDTDGILFFNDGYQGDKLNTLCILGKKYYDRFGYIYYPEYKSGYCDDEFMQVGYKLKKQTYLDEVIIKHQHPVWGFGEQDIIHYMNSVNQQHDSTLFEQRKAINFEI